MNKKQTVSALLAGIAISAILVGSSIINGSQFTHRALAQAATTTTPGASAGAASQTAAPRPAAGGGTPPVGKSFTWSGVVSSTQDPLLGHEKHTIAMILPPRPDGAVYTGVLTYSSSKPVETVVLHAFNLPNSTQVPADFGSLSVSPFGKGQVAVSVITPPTGSSPTNSASVPFAGNAVALHNLKGVKFVATYTVTATTSPAVVKNDISSTKAALTTTTAAGTSGGSTSGGGGGSSKSSSTSEGPIGTPTGKVTKGGSSSSSLGTPSGTSKGK
jgi:hypothetical protein